MRRRAEALLQAPAPLQLEGAWWHPCGLTRDGGLRLIDDGGVERILRRF